MLDEEKNFGFPKWKYHPTFEPALAETFEDEKDLGPGWYNSPAEFGVETAPGRRPDPVIKKAREKFEAQAKGK